MKKLLIGVLALGSFSSFASTYQDRIICRISAKMASETQRVYQLPRALTISMDVLAYSRRNIDIFGLERKLLEQGKYGLTVSRPVSRDVDDLLEISSIRKYTTNDIYINRNGIHNNRVKEFRLKLKDIEEDEIKLLLSEMGYSREILSAANKKLQFKINTEFDRKPFSEVVKFPQEKLTAIFNFSCRNKIQIHGRQF